MKVLFLYICWLVGLASKVEADAKVGCDFNQIKSLISTVDYSKESLPLYENLKKVLETCENSDSFDKALLSNEIDYKQALIHLSLNQDSKALNLFNKIASTNKKDGYAKLAEERAADLNKAYGFWDKIPEHLKNEETVVAGFTFNHYRQEIEKKILNNDNGDMENLFHDAFNLSPNNLNLRLISIDWSLKQLVRELDLSIAYDLIRGYQNVLEKNGSNLSLDQRVHIQFSISVIQWIVLGVEPTTIRKCLSIDMDYVPCKRLSQLYTKIKKINPPREMILDKDIYKSNERIDFDWEKFVDFYLNDKKPAVRLGKDYAFKNNHKLVGDLIADFFEVMIKPDNNANDKVLRNAVKKTDLAKFIDVVLCESAEQYHPRQKQTSQFCKKALKSILTAEQLEMLKKSLHEGQVFTVDELRNIWNSYPHMAMFLIDTLTKKPNTPKQIIDEIDRFFNENDLNNVARPYARQKVDKIHNIINKEREQQWFHQQEHFQQHFHQQNQHQQRHHAPPPPNHTDKDYYKILGVSKEASTKEVRKSYLQLTKKFHPDKQGSLSEDEQMKNQEKMAEINEAYEVLSDDDRRREYDGSRNGGGGGPMFGNMFQGQGNPFEFGKNVKVKFGGFH